ncbi:sensor histidine kinase [Nocardia pseudobrasiliensis]|uniref:histidine kinase n=1 Tax=Nocardia pseudobrasiliensis TaxID=45979 RepID=A0A370IEN6_9NOCA|nr:HAMP domain-containing sensor histidine kinase [Nocardia pseudobrasiliensis]RDI69186.1 signal transduction histidine kinase [Nocardia pseudobrasiliensis]
MSGEQRPALARLRRTRWMLTALVTTITAICVLVLGIAAARVDTQSRSRGVDNDLDRVAGGLARALLLTEDGHAIDVSTITGDELANQRTAVVVMTRENRSSAWRQAHAYLRSQLPGDAELEMLASDTIDRSDQQIYKTLMNTGTGRSGDPVRIAATPVFWNDNEIDTVVMAGAPPVAGADAHRWLVIGLLFGGLLIVAAAAAAGHLLSGRSMRAAIAVLDEHEQFLADAAHELRTPLTTMKLITESRPRTPEDVDRVLAETRGLADRMGRLVTGLLARARLQAGIAEPERTLLRLDQLAETVAEDLPHARITVDARPSVVLGDPELLSLALRNMIENAVHHGSVNKLAPVEVHVAEGRVSVRDHGPGIDPALAANPFDRGAVGRSGRHGIGLALVAWVARVHGGNAAIEPAAGGGTIATLWLPPAELPVAAITKSS